jgi:hypothetical protein
MNTKHKPRMRYDCNLKADCCKTLIFQRRVEWKHREMFNFCSQRAMLNDSQKTALKRNSHFPSFYFIFLRYHATKLYISLRPHSSCVRVVDFNDTTHSERERK